MKEQYKKESPVLSLLGMGGGGTGVALGGLTVPKTYVDDVFSTYLYEGNGGTKTINNGIDLAGEGGLTWVKQRNVGRGHNLCDTERGATKILSSNNTSGEGTYSTTITGFTNTGFSVGSDSGVNHSTGTYTSWTFHKAPGFFDVVTFSASSNQIPHSLGSTPGMIMVKRTDAASDWFVYHRSFSNPNTNYMKLNDTPGVYSGVNGNWEATDTYFKFQILGSGTWVAYVFAHDEASFGTDGDESIIKCGQFEAVPGTAVNLGFEPQFLLLKTIDSTRGWFLIDNMRGMGGETTSNSEYLFADTTGQDDDNRSVFITPTGFKVATSTSFANNTHIYMAIRRPHKPPTAATEVFAMDTGSTSSTTPTFDSGFVVDAALEDNYLHARLCGAQSMFTYLARVNNSDTLSTWDSNLGWAQYYNSSTLSYMFKRAPGFFDVVTYAGDDANVQNIPHNLTVKPEVMLIKNRQLGVNWTWYDAVNGATKNMQLPDNGPSGTSSGSWNDTEPTSSVFTVGTNNTSVNGRPGDGETHIAFLFATLPGISKVGSYTGTGNAINVDCGFTNGARFILIKRSSGANPAGDWYYWDTFNGIVGGNDSYNRLNLSPSRVTGTDYIDPLSAGFTVTASAPATLNVTGSTYVFLAIA